MVTWESSGSPLSSEEGDLKRSRIEEPAARHKCTRRLGTGSGLVSTQLGLGGASLGEGFQHKSSEAQPKPWEALESPGKPRDFQASPGNSRDDQGRPGRSREAQGSQGKSGEVSDPASPGFSWTWSPCSLWSFLLQLVPGSPRAPTLNSLSTPNPGLIATSLRTSLRMVNKLKGFQDWGF